MGAKARFLVLVALIFGLPTLIVVSLLSTDAGTYSAPAPDADQPGGTITGVVRGVEGGGFAAHDVELVLVADGGERTSAARTSTDAEGRFSFLAPPVRGHYEIHAGGGTWQSVRKAWSFLDERGRTLGEREVVLVVLPGVDLKVRFVRADGRPAGDGEYELSGEMRQGFFFGLVHPSIRQAGPIRAGEIRVGGLPPMSARLVARMSTGESVEIDLELEPGENEKRVQL